MTTNLDKLSLMHPPFLLGLIAGGAVIFWFTGASIQAVTTGAYRAVEFIKANIKLDGVEKASVADSKKVVEICTQYAQKGMFNIFLTVFFSTLAFAFVEPFFFIGYLVSIALFGLFQAVFMANAGGAWDNAKKIVEVELKMKGTPLHAATVVGDTVGDPFKDTSSVAMNPVIKFTTLFGLLAVELAVSLTAQQGAGFTSALAAGFFAVSRCSCGARSTGCGFRSNCRLQIADCRLRNCTDSGGFSQIDESAGLSRRPGAGPVICNRQSAICNHLQSVVVDFRGFAPLECRGFRPSRPVDPRRPQGPGWYFPGCPGFVRVAARRGRRVGTLSVRHARGSRSGGYATPSRPDLRVSRFRPGGV